MKTRKQIEAGIAEAQEKIKLNSMTYRQSSNTVQREKAGRAVMRATSTLHALEWVLKDS